MLCFIRPYSFLVTHLRSSLTSSCSCRYGFISPEGVRPGHQRRVSTSLYLQSNMPKKARRNHHLRLLVNPFDSEKPAEMLQSPALQHKDASKEKEIERAKKWRAMAVTMTASKTNRWRRKETGKQIEGSGSSWKFITTDAKVSHMIPAARRCCITHIM